MTLTELRDKADAKLATFWSALVTKQNAYHAKHGKFFQLLVSPENAVVDGADSDFTTRNPSDERFAVDVDFAWTEKIPFNITVDEWVGNGIVGFKATVVVELPNGDRYTRSRTYEPQPDVLETETYTIPEHTDETTGELVPAQEAERKVSVPQDPVQNDSGWSKIEEDVIA